MLGLFGNIIQLSEQKKLMTWKKSIYFQHTQVPDSPVSIWSGLLSFDGLCMEFYYKQQILEGIYVLRHWKPKAFSKATSVSWR